MTPHSRSVVLLAILFIGSLKGEQDEALKTSLCELYRSPGKYAGKLVQVRATVVGGREVSLEPPASKTADCPAYLTITLQLPQGVIPKSDFELQDDASYQQYRAAMHQPKRIEATFEGRFDVAFMWKDKVRLRIGEGPGFGHAESYDAQLVLKRVTDVVSWFAPTR